MIFRKYLFLILPLLSVHCGNLKFNNPGEPGTLSFWQMEVLRCALQQGVCSEKPILQDNQGIKVWTRLLGGGIGVLANARSSATDRDGNTYITGITNGPLSGQPMFPFANLEALFVSKFNSEGNLLWTRLMGSNELSSFYAGYLHVDRFGDLILSATGGGDINGQSPNGDGYLLIKLSPEGNVIWTRIYPTPDETVGYGITSDGNGNIYITGNTEAELFHSETADGGRKAYLIKYDRNGNLVWSRLLGELGVNVFGYGVASDFSGNVFLTGAVGGGGVSLLGIPLVGVTDSFVAYYTTDGTRQWLRLSGIALASTESLAVSWDGMGSAYLAGYTTGNLDSQIKAGSEVQMLSKYNVAGVKLWTRLLGGGGSSATSAANIYADNAGHIYTTGSTNGNLGGNTQIGLKDGYLSKYDSEGNQIWTRTFGVSGSSTSSKGMSSDIYGVLYLTGDTDGNLDGQTKSGTQDSFLIKYK